MTHGYTSQVSWTGNRGDGTVNYGSYDRTWDVAIPGKPVVHCSNDPLLGGEGSDLTRAEQIHHEIHAVCFIARSVNFPVEYAPVFETR